MAIIIANAFSLGMVPSWMDEHGGADISVRPVSFQDDVATDWLNADDRVWAVGHADTSAVLGMALFGEVMAAQRVNVSLSPDDALYVAQLRGGRLPEGSTTLPEGFSFKWLEVTIRPKN